MFDLFESIKEADNNRIKPINLKEYFNYRDADLNKGLLSGIIRFYTSLYITPEELKLVRPTKENFIKYITFINDVYSFEKEVLAAKSGFELSVIYSSILIVIDLYSIYKALPYLYYYLKED
ncbi:hypothetical protein G7Y89_g6574 [Cudoniella acicularis]|uniref:Terpene synthase n=1 Tax=Cudoniella acicularis TaxID=354080 RepID=A0A8H4RMQ6_9HELO|nr:hypothetical protein G7Y89_g6574 [Cudoniella acicularis]